MDLVLKVNLTFVEIQSDKSESAKVFLPIGPHIKPLQGTHLGPPQ